MLEQLKMDAKYGAFRVLDETGAIIKSGCMNEQEATDLAEIYAGSIEHQNPDTKLWRRW